LNRRGLFLGGTLARVLETRRFFEGGV